jgi:hypothetical protein
MSPRWSYCCFDGTGDTKMRYFAAFCFAERVRPAISILGPKCAAAGQRAGQGRTGFERERR